MAFTRFSYDEARTKKALQQATDPGRWVMNVPGNGGDTPSFMLDPHILAQKWGGNLRTNAVNLESELRGSTRPLGRDCVAPWNPVPATVTSAVAYPESAALTTDQSRATHPAWWSRDAEQPFWQHLPLNPQANVCFPFENNVSSRIQEKDAFVAKRECHRVAATA